MKTIVLDSYALLAYFEKEPGWEHVADVLAEAEQDDVSVLGCIVNWGEILYITQRTYGANTATRIEHVLDELPISWVEADRGLTRIAATLKAGGGLAYADCFAAALAIREQGAVITGDPEFARIEDRVEVKWMPR